MTSIHGEKSARFKCDRCKASAGMPLMEGPPPGWTTPAHDRDLCPACTTDMARVPIAPNLVPPSPLDKTLHKLAPCCCGSTPVRTQQSESMTPLRYEDIPPTGIPSGRVLYGIVCRACGLCVPLQAGENKAVRDWNLMQLDTTMPARLKGLWENWDEALAKFPGFQDDKALPERTAQKGEADPTGRAPSTPGAKLDAGKTPLLRGAVGYFPRALAAVAMVSEHGAKKYTWKGWETVPDGINRYGDALMRHLCSEHRGEVFDQDSQCMHAAHAAWNALARLELLLREKEVQP